MTLCPAMPSKKLRKSYQIMDENSSPQSNRTLCTMLNLHFMRGAQRLLSTYNEHFMIDTSLEKKCQETIRDLSGVTIAQSCLPLSFKTPLFCHI